MSFSKCPSIRGRLVHDPALFQVRASFFGLIEHKQISIPAKAEILIQLHVANLPKVQAGMVMDQPLPLRQASVAGFCSGVWDGGDLEFGSDTTPLMNDI